MHPKSKIRGAPVRILVAEKSSFSERGLQALAQIAPTDVYDLTQEQLSGKVGQYHILVVRLGLQVNEQVLAAAKALRVVGTPTTGLDHVDTLAVQRREIAVISLKGERAFLEGVYATAEHTFALLLSLIRRIPTALEAVRSYEWRRDLYRGSELHGKTLGIIGCGRLGGMVARYGAAFGMQVLAYDPFQVDLPAGVERCESLKDLLSRSHVISLHVPLNDETRGMISDSELASMLPGAVLINTARGDILDEMAVMRSLESGQLAGAALDVLCGEHRLGEERFHPLIEYARTHGNLIITPHIAGATMESVEKADLFVANKIKEYIHTNLT